MQPTNRNLDRRKRSRRRFNRVSHETPTGRRLLGRSFRRTQKHRLRKGAEELLPVIGKDYKTRGWITR